MDFGVETCFFLLNLPYFQIKQFAYVYVRYLLSNALTYIKIRILLIPLDLTRFLSVSIFQLSVCLQRVVVKMREVVRVHFFTKQYLFIVRSIHEPRLISFNNQPVETNVLGVSCSVVDLENLTRKCSFLAVKVGRFYLVVHSDKHCRVLCGLGYFIVN